MCWAAFIAILGGGLGTPDRDSDLAGLGWGSETCELDPEQSLCPGGAVAVWALFGQLQGVAQGSVFLTSATVMLLAQGLSFSLGGIGAALEASKTFSVLTWILLETWTS